MFKYCPLMKAPISSSIILIASLFRCQLTIDQSMIGHDDQLWKVFFSCCLDLFGIALNHDQKCADLTLVSNLISFFSINWSQHSIFFHSRQLVWCLRHLAHLFLSFFLSLSLFWFHSLSLSHFVSLIPSPSPPFYTPWQFWYERPDIHFHFLKWRFRPKVDSFQETKKLCQLFIQIFNW